MVQPDIDRRPGKARSSGWARGMAGALARAGIPANAVSLASMAFAVAGAAMLLAWRSPWALVGCGVAIQLRLLCNLFDGMIAIEGARSSALGYLYNEFPDRVSDSVFIVALGHASGFPEAGWFGALAAALTAYVRATGGALGLPQDFRGPMGKPHRMATMTAGCLAGALELATHGTTYALAVAVWTIAIGSVATCVTRTVAIAMRLQQRAP